MANHQALMHLDIQNQDQVILTFKYPRHLELGSLLIWINPCRRFACNSLDDIAGVLAAAAIMELREQGYAIRGRSITEDDWWKIPIQPSDQNRRPDLTGSLTLCAPKLLGIETLTFTDICFTAMEKTRTRYGLSSWRIMRVF